MRYKLLSASVALAIGAMCAMPAASQVRPDVLVKQRQAAMVLQGKYFYGHLRPTAQGKMPVTPYTWLHPGARLASADVDRLCQWSDTERAKPMETLRR